MKFSRDTWLGIGIILTLVLVTSLSALQNADENQTPYLSTSSAPHGTLALSLWLNELGYETAESFSFSFAPTSDVKIIFLIEPLVTITNNEWKLLDQWLQEGGTLVLAGNNSVSESTMQHFRFNLVYLLKQAQELNPALPILQSPVLTSNVELQTDFRLATTRTDFTVLMTANGEPVVLTFPQGEGQVILSSTPAIFTNQELKKEPTAMLILNLVAFADKSGSVLFDEWHRGFQTTPVIGPTQWLQNTPGGHAILFAVIVIFIALLLQGRAFGRPIPLSHEFKRRAPMEHIVAIANLNHKARHQAEVAQQYHHRLKRFLGHRYRLDPSIPDEEYVDALASYNSTIDKAELLHLLKKLSQKNINETDLLQYSAQASKWMSE